MKNLGRVLASHGNLEIQGIIKHVGKVGEIALPLEKCSFFN